MEGLSTYNSLKYFLSSKEGGRILRLERAKLEFVCRVVEAMEEAGTDKQQLKKDSGLTAKRINSMLRSDANLKISEMTEIAKALGKELVISFREVDDEDL